MWNFVAAGFYNCFAVICHLLCRASCSDLVEIICKKRARRIKHCANSPLLLRSAHYILPEVPQMAFCKACGSELGGATFCPKCGASQSASAVPAPSAPAVSTEGLSENVAALLSYVLGLVTGIIFLLIDKRPFVKFHAAQSIVVFGALMVIRIGFAMVMGAGGLLGFGLWAAISMLIGLLTLVLWILLMVKAYKHELYRVPIAAGIADGIAGK